VKSSFGTLFVLTVMATLPTLAMAADSADRHLNRGVQLLSRDKNKEALEEARTLDPEARAWVENSFKEGDISSKNRLLANYGKGLFNNQCAPCHGIAGNGKGQAAFTMTKRPANFDEDRFATYTTDTWYWRISRGVPGTQMPRWEYTLDANQRLTLAAFLKYVAQNKGLGKLQGAESDYNRPPAPATPAPSRFRGHPKGAR